MKRSGTVSAVATVLEAARTLAVAIVGGGTMGLATAWALSERGARVTVFERYTHVHEYGSHGGYTRIIRQAYHEGSDYVPLVQEADRTWLSLAARSGRTLLVRTGMIDLGDADEPELLAAIAACRDHGVEHAILDAAAVMRRWPFHVPPSWQGCFTPSGGYLRVGPCLDVLRDLAVDHGADLHYGARVEAIERAGPRVHVRLEGSDRAFAFDRVVVTAGAGLLRLVPEAVPGLSVRRRVQLWTRPEPHARTALAGLPVWCAFLPEASFYGFPWNDEGIEGLKLGRHTTVDRSAADESVDPETLERSVSDADLAPLRAFLDQHLPSGRGPVAGTRVCMYTTTPCWDFLIDRAPFDDDVILAGGFSGHGFKFAPAIGRCIADMLLRDGVAPATFRRSRHVALANV